MCVVRCLAAFLAFIHQMPVARFSPPPPEAPDTAECPLGSDSPLVENHHLRVTPVHHLSTHGFSHQLCKARHSCWSISKGFNLVGCDDRPISKLPCASSPQQAPSVRKPAGPMGSLHLGEAPPGSGGGGGGSALVVLEH